MINKPLLRKNKNNNIVIPPNTSNKLTFSSLKISSLFHMYKVIKRILKTMYQYMTLDTRLKYFNFYSTFKDVFENTIMEHTYSKILN